MLADLDPDQRRAVTTESRLVAVIAGAGSGKTRVLTRRVAHRIAIGSADIQHTVVLTFTREAAGEFRRRLPRLGVTERITAGTFHSVAHAMLRQRWADLDRAPKNLLTDRRRVVGDLMGHDRLDELIIELDWATGRLITPDGYTAAVRRGDRRATVEPARVAEALDAYQREKHRRGVIDLDDLLAMTIDEIERSAEFAAAVRWRFRHVLVDEAQDLDPLQHRFIDLLRAGNDDLFMVGDPAQSIYGFNGSDPTLLIEVSDWFPGIEIVRLPVNHRCTPQIVDAGAFALESSNQHTEIRSARSDGRSVEIANYDDEHDEAEGVAQQIARLDPTMVRSGNVAVLARTHAVLAPVRAALSSAGVPIRRIVDGAASPLTPMLLNAYRVPDGERMRRWAQDQLEIESERTSHGDDDRSPGGEVALAVLDFLREHPTGDGAELRTWVERTDPFGRDDPGVDVLTFHGAKGREWQTVFLVGCETALVPHRSAVTVAAKAEEARLLYVAMTRASDVLTVNWARRRGGYRRKRTPLLDGFTSVLPDRGPPPEDLRSMPRNDRADTLARLRQWRAGTARASGILPDALCTDHTLARIADERPATPEQLDSVTGLGPLTARRLFEGVAAALGVVSPADRP